jgi:hypothetical protein
MSINQRMQFQSGLLTIEADGEFSLEEAKSTFMEILGAVAQYQAQKVLFDGRNVRGKPREFERFLYGDFAAKETIKLVNEHGIVPRFAYVLRPPLRDPQRYGETVAVNRGMIVKTFETPEEALKWLEPIPPGAPVAGA